VFKVIIDCELAAGKVIETGTITVTIADSYWPMLRRLACGGWTVIVYASCPILNELILVLDLLRVKT